MIKAFFRSAKAIRAPVLSTNSLTALRTPVISVYKLFCFELQLS